jgi:hypothetical protein
MNNDGEFVLQVVCLVFSPKHKVYLHGWWDDERRQPIKVIFSLSRFVFTDSVSSRFHFFVLE